MVWSGSVRFGVARYGDLPRCSTVISALTAENSRIMKDSALIYGAYRTFVCFCTPSPEFLAPDAADAAAADR